MCFETRPMMPERCTDSCVIAGVDFGHWTLDFVSYTMPAMEVLRKSSSTPPARLRSGWRLGLFVAIYVLLMFFITGGSRVVYVLANLAAPNWTLPRTYRISCSV
jgi:hypothetical protein